MNIHNQWTCVHGRDSRKVTCADCAAALNASSWATAKDNDPISPDHYKVGGIETIDFMQAKLTPEEFAGYCKGNMLKYITRAGHKDDAGQDMRKALWYGERWLRARNTRS